MKFYALEPHVAGTTQYARGDEREVENEHDVQHLVELKVLSTEPVKAEEPLANKAEGKAPANKSA